MINGFLNINKAADMTSHDVVNRVRRILNTKKIGHAGTLDPFATGVLPVAVGKATKFIEYLANCDKSYRGEIFFGIETSTGDITGEIINQYQNFKMPPRNLIDEVLKSFVGTIQQTPPKYSAIKINGQKAYELARKNVEFNLPSREVKIYNLAIVEQSETTLTVDIDCSKGTYIRALAVDIGKKFDTLATLKSLQRTRVGKFSIADSVTIEELQNIGDEAIIKVDSCLEHLPCFYLPPYRLKAFCSGLSTRVDENFDEGSIFRVYVNNEFVGTGKIIDGEIKVAKSYKTYLT